MGSAIDSGTTSPGKDDVLYRKLAFAICGALFQHKGTYEESFSEWFLALRLIVPDLEHPRDLIDAFERLAETGIIELHRRGAARYNGWDQCFFLGSPFTAVLLPCGMIRKQRS